MRHHLFVYLLPIILLACSPQKKEQFCMDDSHGFELLDSLEKVKNGKQVDSSNEATNRLVALNNAFIDIQSVNPAIRVDLKYAGSDNFMHDVMYKKIRKAYLQKEVALRLAKCQDWLSANYPGYYLLVYDAARPVDVQQRMWDALDSIPVKRRVYFVSNPANRSLHNYGAAVDLTICDADGKPLDMGAGYDDMREIAYPRFEKKFLASGELSKKQVTNRDILRKTLYTQHFNQLETEWWHFNACSRSEAKRKFQPLLTEEELIGY